VAAHRSRGETDIKVTLLATDRSGRDQEIDRIALPDAGQSFLERRGVVHRQAVATGFTGNFRGAGGACPRTTHGAARVTGAAAARIAASTGIAATARIAAARESDASASARERG
jgi:hypothetical protein